MTRLHPLARLVLAAIGLLAVQTLALGVYLVGARLQHPAETLAQSLANAVNRDALLLTLYAYPPSLLWLGFCRAKLDGRSFVSLGLRRLRPLPHIGRGVLAGTLTVAVLWSILWIAGAIAVGGFSQVAAQAGARAVFPLLGWAIAFAAVGFFEEVVFRGYALHNLTNWLGWKAAVVVQALIFAVIHLGNVATAPKTEQMAALGGLPSIFLIGVFFAVAYRKTGSLWFPIAFHAAWDFSLGCLFSLPVSGLKTFQLLDVAANETGWLSGGSFGAEGSFFLLPILVALIYFMSLVPDHPQALLDLGLLKVAPQPAVAPVEISEPIEPIEAEARENRYRARFGTSEGFDSEMLRELRVLQNEREAAEAQTRRERETTQTVIEVERFTVPIAVEDLAPESENVPVEAETPPVESAPVEVVEVVEVEVSPVEVNVPVAEPVVAQKPVEAPQPSALAPVPAKKKSLPKW